MRTMSALRFYGRRDLRLEEIPCPRPMSEEVLVEITDAGLSQTQINEFAEGPFLINSEPHVRTGINSPLIPCQEFGGRIVELGSDIKDQDLLGKLVAILPLEPCYECPACKEDTPHRCETLAYKGLLGANGGFCGYISVSVDDLFIVERQDLLTFIEPLLIGVHSLKRAAPHNADNYKVLVIGGGAVGCAVAAVWQYIGGSDVTLCDRLSPRVERCRNMGFKAVDDINDCSDDFDIVIDAAGKDSMVEKQAFEVAFDFCRPGGTVVSMASYFSPLNIIPTRHIVTEISTIPSFAYDFQDVETLRNNIHKITCSFDPVIKRLRLDQLVEHGYYEAELDKSLFTRIVCSENG